MNKLVYCFGKDITEGNKNLANLLGNKGANLAQMALLDIPVPPGFTISTNACKNYFQSSKNLSSELIKEIESSLLKIENIMNASLGDEQQPLLLSIRSGAPVSMPGMMDTILNLGLNDITTKALAKVTNNERFAYDCYRRFIQMYSQIVLHIDHYLFEDILELKKQNKNINKDSDLELEDLQDLVDQYKIIVKNESGSDFPQDTKVQLWSAIKAVFDSWMNPRAISYRQINNYSENYGTAVNVQVMVFGNMDNNSATGVAFTRDPSTGEKIVYGEYLINAQGEDVVAGIRTPQVISAQVKKNEKIDFPPLEVYMPGVYKDLTSIFSKLESYYKDMQDVEFTIQQGRIWILQTRSGKRSAKAAIKIAIDLVNEGLITKTEAINNIDVRSLDQLLHPTIDPSIKYESISVGLPASPGAVSGRVYFDAKQAEIMAKIHDVILVRHETSPEDINGMNAAKGILTAKGGMTSHAAVVARGMGKSCVCGAGDLLINYSSKYFMAENIRINEGEIITINGSTGEVIKGSVPTILPNMTDDFYQIMSWAKEIKSLNVRVNAEVANEVNLAKKFGAEGIGLCRTEHMFFDVDRINAVREMILANDSEDRKNALDQILLMQVKDFEEIFKIMSDLPVNIRLLDPPLHEFLPHEQNDILILAKNLGVSEEQIINRVQKLKEHNPMLGHRGCRLGITMPEIYEMQAKAIFMAMKNAEALGHRLSVEIMVPFVITQQEFVIVKKNILNQAEIIFGDKLNNFNYTIGTMIELPRACMIADQIAQTADFFSFGTNDLTQTTLGISRDDCASFMSDYIENKILLNDPFTSIDLESVGELIKIAVSKGKSINKDLKIGVCGEHGGDINSINFFDKIGLNYVSCSTFRIPQAIIAAAQAKIRSS